MAFLKREWEKGRSEGRREGRREMKEHDRQWREWRERVKTDPKAEPPPPPKEDD